MTFLKLACAALAVFSLSACKTRSNNDSDTKDFMVRNESGRADIMFKITALKTFPEKMKQSMPPDMCYGEGVTGGKSISVMWLARGTCQADVGKVQQRTPQFLILRLRGNDGDSNHFVTWDETDSGYRAGLVDLSWFCNDVVFAPCSLTINRQNNAIQFSKDSIGVREIDNSGSMAVLFKITNMRTIDPPFKQTLPNHICFGEGVSSGKQIFALWIERGTCSAEVGKLQRATPQFVLLNIRGYDGDGRSLVPFGERDTNFRGGLYENGELTNLCTGRYTCKVVFDPKDNSFEFAK